MLLNAPAQFPNSLIWRNFLRQAYNYALENSDDPSTKVGAIAMDLKDCRVLSYGSNHLISPSMRLDPANTERPRKYKLVQHAERDAILKWLVSRKVARVPILVCPWAACCDCATAIVDSGIKHVVVHKQAIDRTHDHWKEDLEIAKYIFKECGVGYYMYDGDIGGVKSLHDYKIWEP